jgi:2-desacetyl-2-hydroxyethyl bacteriochlorophyllide A dehydrogenase
MGSDTRISLYFNGPGQVTIQEETLPKPGTGQVLVRTVLSAISAGTESLVYRGLFPQDLSIDENILSLEGKFEYPLKYGYSAVGKVIDVGLKVAPTWKDRYVFAFNPHESHFLAETGDLQPLPQGMAPENAVFLPNMETAVNLVMDGEPLIGERVVVFGQGIVGLLTTALLSRFPLERLITADKFALRRQASLDLGAHASLEADDSDLHKELQAYFPPGADLVYELSGSPAALEQAIASVGFSGRVVIGSWYGQKRANLDLGGRFHRSRIRLISSQVSTLAPELSGRWDKARRFGLAWKMLAQVGPSRFISHRFPLRDADQAYSLLDHHPEEALQVVLTYP